MERLAFILGLMVILCGSIHAKYEMHNMDEKCNHTLILTGKHAIRLSYTRTTGWGSPNCSICALGIESGIGLDYRLAITIDKMDLKPSGDALKDCEPNNRLELYSGKEETKRITDDHGLCGKLTSGPTFHTGTNFLVLYYNFEMKEGYGQGFNATITPFHRGECKEGTDGEDIEGGREFECGTGRCIQATLMCDEYDNCGNYGDELDCSKKIGLWLIALVTVGMVLILCVVGTVIKILRKECRDPLAAPVIKEVEEDRYAYASFPEPKPSKYWHGMF